MVVFTVQQALTYLKELFETNPILGDLWISGEVSNLTRSAAGHVYFTLKDSAGQLRCVFFRRQNAGTVLEHGAEVVAHGRVSIYEARGELNFIVDFAHPQGAGILNAQYERLKEVLEAEGLFDGARKRPLPVFPRRVGVVTSPGGAVIHDICTIVERRWPMTEIVIAPTVVQGDAAAPGIVAALNDLNERGNVDVIIVARGGGSLEELWPFNDERVCRAIYASTVPVVSAIGHETDVTLSDYVADLRAPTPSAAAELVVPNQLQIAMRVGGLAQALDSCMRHELETHAEQIERIANRLDDGFPDIADMQTAVASLAIRAHGRTEQLLESSRSLVAARTLQLGSLSPLAVLARGFAMIHDREGRLVAHHVDVQPGMGLLVRLQDGAFSAEVRGQLDS